MTPTDAALALTAAGLDPADHDYEFSCEWLNDFATVEDLDVFAACMPAWRAARPDAWRTGDAIDVLVSARRHELEGDAA